MDQLPPGADLTKIAAATPPHGKISNFDYYPLQNVTIVVISIITFLQLLFLSIRLFTKLNAKQGVLFDDCKSLNLLVYRLYLCLLCDQGAPSSLQSSRSVLEGYCSLVCTTLTLGHCDIVLWTKTPAGKNVGKHVWDISIAQAIDPRSAKVRTLFSTAYLPILGVD
jgi:hypothetical protein